MLLSKGEKNIIASDGKGGTIALFGNDKGVFLSYLQIGRALGGLIPLVEKEGALVLDEKAYAKRPWEPIRSLQGYEDLLKRLRT